MTRSLRDRHWIDGKIQVDQHKNVGQCSPYHFPVQLSICVTIVAFRHVYTCKLSHLGIFLSLSGSDNLVSSADVWFCTTQGAPPISPAPLPNIRSCPAGLCSIVAACGIRRCSSPIYAISSAIAPNSQSKLGSSLRRYKIAEVTTKTGKEMMIV